MMDIADKPPTNLSAANPCLEGPAGRAVRLLGDVWTLMIVYALMSGTKRFGELLETMSNVSPKTVSQRLKKLEEIGFVQRQAYAEIPPRVEYSLTERGLALADILGTIRRFGELYMSDLPDASAEACLSPTQT